MNAQRDEDGHEFCAPGCWNISDVDAVGKAWFNALCPCGCGDPFMIPIQTGPKQDGSWEWDGNMEVPTLSPSILRIGGCAWHGFFQAGKWNWCAGTPLAANCVSPGKEV